MASRNFFYQSFSDICRIGATAGLILGALGPVLTAGAQSTAPPLNRDDLILHRLSTSPNDVRAHRNARGLGSRLAQAAQSPSAKNPQETVLYEFLSPSHGAYPALGVIRDPAGNLYGTTNGSYSDIGGGGKHDAGVVFKIDPSGRETLLYDFKGAADGGSPNGLVRDSAGNLYGTASLGGAASAGVVFEIDPSGNETVLYSFTGGADGGSPNGLVRDRKGNLYGTTAGGGASGYGVVFEIDASGKATVLYSFTGGADGANPNSFVALDSAGNFYGATNYGGNAAGTAGDGVVFKVDPSGHETVLHTFAGGSDGAQPNGVMLDAQGNLYGTTSAGGAAEAGVVFELDPAGHETVLYSFTGGDDGASPLSGLTRDAKGNLYGTTGFGGSTDRGVVFKIDAAGHEAVLHTFSRGFDGDEPDESGVILDPAGNLYGTTSFGGSGGAGTVYKLNARGDVAVLYAFPGINKGQYPYNAGVISGSDGHLYGTTFYGGARGAGVIYHLDENGDEGVSYTFSLLSTHGFGQPTGDLMRDEAGTFYGTTFIGQSDTGFGYGVVYSVDADGEATVLHNFTGGADGGDPYGGVIADGKGNLFGTASGGGGSNAGVVFEIDRSGHETVLYSFSGGADGGGPLGRLLRDPAGNLYGTTNGGGAAGAGVVFKLDPTGHETVLYSFTGNSDGAYPLAGLVRDPAGNLYGTTVAGGASGAGVVFELDMAGRESVLHSFTGGSDGGSPLWVTLARDAAGNLYGTTTGGGAANAGVVFKLDPAGNETVLHDFTGGDDGGTPEAGVILGKGGRLVGTTAFGGRANVGVVFEITP